MDKNNLPFTLAQRCLKEIIEAPQNNECFSFLYTSKKKTKKLSELFD